MYDRRIWQDSVRDPERTYTQTKNADGTVTMVPAGREIQKGTNQSQANFNSMEDGIQDANIAQQVIFQHQLQKEFDYDTRVGTLEEDCIVETGVITLTNTSKYPFNNSIKTVSLAKTRDTTNYYVEVELQEYSGGLPGDVEVSGKALNGFKIEFNGSATSVKVKYQIKGGILS